MATLEHLQDIGFPDLIEFDRNSMIDEIIARIKTHPLWQNSWDGELYQNSTFFIINLFGDIQNFKVTNVPALIFIFNKRIYCFLKNCINPTAPTNILHSHF